MNRHGTGDNGGGSKTDIGIPNGFHVESAMGGELSKRQGVVTPFQLVTVQFIAERRILAVLIMDLP